MNQPDRNQPARGPLAVALSSVLACTLAGAGIGFWVGHYAAPPAPNLSQTVAKVSTANPSAAPIPPSAEARPAPGIGQTPATATPEVDAISARLGNLQSELARLNALGERLAEMSGLDKQGFDFQKPVPQGGAEDGPVKDYTIKEIASELGSMVSLLKDRKRKLEILEEAISGKDPIAWSAPAGWPVRSGYISSNYGFRIHPTKHRRLFHQGIDFAAPRGTPVIAVADGTVTFSGRRSGYGNLIEVRHANGYSTRYGHNSANLVRVGQQVRKGQDIARVGATGTATGPHVHFEVMKDGEHLNPARFAGRSPAASTTLAQAGNPG